MEGILADRFDYLARIWKLRYFWFSLVQKDLRTRYRRSFFGVGWSLLRPLAMTAIFCLIFAKILNVTPGEYAPFLLIGMTVWQFFVESSVKGCKSFYDSRDYIKQQLVPLAIFPLRTVLGAGFHSLISLGLALFFTSFLRGFENPWALVYLIPAVLYLFALCWFTAIISGILYTHFPDTDHLLDMALQMLFYVTPIMIIPKSIPNRGWIQMLYRWNPITSVLALVRDPILDGAPPSMESVQISLAFLALACGVAVVLLRKTERTLIFWI